MWTPLIFSCLLCVTQAFPYTIFVHTGKEKAAGTDARVYIDLYGGCQGEEQSRRFYLDGGDFENGDTDVFNVDAARSFSPLSRVEVGHDNTGIFAAWFLDSVEVLTDNTGLVQSFPFNNWLDEDEDTLSVVLEEDVGAREGGVSLDEGYPYNITIRTNNGRMAGTDSKVTIVLHSACPGNQTSQEVVLDGAGDVFEIGTTNSFQVHLSELVSPISHIEVSIDDTGVHPDWKLDSVEIYSPVTGIEQVFPYHGWIREPELSAVVGEGDVEDEDEGGDDDEQDEDENEDENEQDEDDDNDDEDGKGGLGLELGLGL